MMNVMENMMNVEIAMEMVSLKENVTVMVMLRIAQENVVVIQNLMNVVFVVVVVLVKVNVIVMGM